MPAKLAPNNVTSIITKGNTAALDDTAISCRMGPSIWKPSQTVPIYFVSKLNLKGHFSALNDAISFAKPYCRIEVLSGRYTENVIVHKPIEIGCASGEAVEFYSNSHTLVITAEEAFIEGITVRTGSQKYACSIQAGTCTIQGCVMESLEVCGGACPNIIDNSIVGGRVHGIHVSDHSGGTYKNNTIERHVWYSVCVESDGSPFFTYNKIKSGEQGQVLIRGPHGRNPVTNNTLRGKCINLATTNNIRQLCESGAHSFLYSKQPCSTVMSKDASVSFQSTGAFHSGTSFDGTSPEIVVNPYFRYNHITDKKYVAEPGSYNTGECSVGGDASNGKSSDMVKRVHHKVTNGTCGIRKKIAALQELLSLPIRQSGDIICLIPVDMNRYHNTKQLQSDKVGTTEGGHVSIPFDSRAAVVVSCRAAPTFVENTIVGGINNGILVRQGGLGTFENNYLSSNVGWGFIIEDAESLPTLIGNMLYCNGLGGLCVNRAGGVVKKNKFIDNRGCQVLVTNGQDFTFTNNDVVSGDQIGVICRDEGTVTITQNLFDGGGDVALVAETGAEPVVSDNVFVLSSGVSW